MCGRTACTLQPSKLCEQCKFQDRQKKRKTPVWKNAPVDPDRPSASDYVPSYNFAPESFGPVMVSGCCFLETYDKSDRIIQPMKWGLIPSWHKGDPKDFPYRMINARADSLLDKASFRNALKQGRRCVVLADGFYEWKASGGAKVPYFIHFAQEKFNYKTDSDSELESKGLATTESLPAQRLLTMAGIFDIAQPKNSVVPLYSYTVITVASANNISFIHERMPAVLDGEDAVESWLNADEVHLEEALNLLQPVKTLQFYEVGSYVSNVRNKGRECIKPLTEVKGEKRKSSQPTLTSFFKKK